MSDKLYTDQLSPCTAGRTTAGKRLQWCPSVSAGRRAWTLQPNPLVRVEGQRVFQLGLKEECIPAIGAVRESCTHSEDLKGLPLLQRDVVQWHA